MKLFSVLTAVIALGLCSCERHEWESDPGKTSDTINLFKHDDHAAGDDHKKEGEHSKPEGEHEKKDADSGE